MEDITMMFDTPQQISRFCLISLRGRLRLEKVGMKCRGRSARSIVADMFGVGKRTPHDDLIALLQAELDKTTPVA